MLYPRLSDFEEATIEWLWHGRLAAGMVTILEADMGIGKGFMAMDLIARVTRGWSMPGETADSAAAPSQVREPADVLLCSTEDNWFSIVRSRALAAGADLSRIIPTRPLDPFDRKLDAVIDATIAAMVLQIDDGTVRLIVVDPWVGLIPGLAPSDGQNVRIALTALTKLAARKGCAALITLHLNRDHYASAIHRGSGSIATAAVARVVLGIGADTEDPSRRILTTVKNNIGAFAPALAFRIVPATVTTEKGPVETGRVEWLGETLHIAEDILSPPKRHRESRMLERAEEMLCDLLADRPMLETDIRAKAMSIGISPRTLRRAKAGLSINSAKIGKQGPWSWSLEPLEEEQKASK